MPTSSSQQERTINTEHASSTQVAKAAFWLGARDTFAVSAGLAGGVYAANQAVRLIDAGSLSASAALGVLALGHLALAAPACHGWATRLEGEGRRHWAVLVRYAVPLAVAALPCAAGTPTSYTVGRFVLSGVGVLLRSCLGQTIDQTIPSLQLVSAHDGKASARSLAVGWQAQYHGALFYAGICQWSNVALGTWLIAQSPPDFAHEAIARSIGKVISDGLFEGPMSVCVLSRVGRHDPDLRVEYRPAKGLKEVAKNLREALDPCGCAVAASVEARPLRTCGNIVVTAGSRLVWGVMATFTSVVLNNAVVTELVRGAAHLRRFSGDLAKDALARRDARPEARAVQDQ